MNEEIKTMFRTFKECSILSSENYLSKFKEQHIINPEERVAMTQICRGFSTANGPSWRDAELCLFEGDDDEYVISVFQDWVEEQPLQAPRMRVACMLDINGVPLRQHILVYFDLAMKYQNILFFIETAHPEVFINIYPPGNILPLNVFLGATLRTESNWERRIGELDKCCSLSRYIRIIDPVLEYDLLDWAWEPDTGEGICWIVADVNPERTFFDESAEFLSLLCNQCEYLGIPFWTECGDFLTSPEFQKLDDIDIVAGKQPPEPPECRLDDIVYGVPLMWEDLTFR